MKVILNDFQILEGENVFEFPNGITVLVGPNASGKSSMFYAIQNALINPNGVDDCINYNHKETRVTIENNDNSITWIRGLGSSTYVNNITKDTYVKSSKLDSRDLADLGFYFDSKNRVVNIHDEWSVLFPFGESDTDMFRLFEDIFNISCSFRIIDEMKKDEQNLKSIISQAQSDKISLQDRLEMLKSIKDRINLDDLNSHILRLSDLSSRASQLEEDYKTFSKNYLYKDVVLPQVYDVSKLYDSFIKFDNIDKDYASYCHLKEKANVVLPKIDLDITIPVFDTQIKDDYEQYCLIKSNIAQLKQEYELLQQQKEDIGSKIKEIKVCPTCGKVMD